MFLSRLVIVFPPPTLRPSLTFPPSEMPRNRRQTPIVDDDDFEIVLPFNPTSQAEPGSSSGNQEPPSLNGPPGEQDGSGDNTSEYADVDVFLYSCGLTADGKRKLEELCDFAELVCRHILYLSLNDSHLLLIGQATVKVPTSQAWASTCANLPFQRRLWFKHTRDYKVCLAPGHRGLFRFSSPPSRFPHIPLS